jgi:hypothetical protein
MPPRHGIRHIIRLAVDHAVCQGLGAATAIATLAGVMALAAMPLPVRADGGTAGSLMSREAAIQQATLWMPPGARITSTSCTELVVDASPRYVCTVQWGPPPQ